MRNLPNGLRREKAARVLPIMSGITRIPTWDWKMLHTSLMMGAICEQARSCCSVYHSAYALAMMFIASMDKAECPKSLRSPQSRAYAKPACTHIYEQDGASARPWIAKLEADVLSSTLSLQT